MLAKASPGAAPRRMRMGVTLRAAGWRVAPQRAGAVRTARPVEQRAAAHVFCLLLTFTIKFPTPPVLLHTIASPGVGHKTTGVSAWTAAQVFLHLIGNHYHSSFMPVPIIQPSRTKTNQTIRKQTEFNQVF